MPSWMEKWRSIFEPYRPKPKTLVKRSLTYVEWAEDHFGINLMHIDPLFTKICAKTISVFFVLSDLDLRPLTF